MANEFRVNTNTDGDQGNATVAVLRPSTALPQGGFVVVYQSNAAALGGGTAIGAQVFDHLGNAVGGEFPINNLVSSSFRQPAVVALPDGGFFVAWAGTQPVPPPAVGEPSSSIGGRRFSMDVDATTGTPVAVAQGGQFLISADPDTDNGQDAPTLALLPGSGAAGDRLVVTWSAAKQDGPPPPALPNPVSDESGAAVVGRIFDIPTSGAPTPLAGEFLVNTTTTGIQVNPSVTALGGGFVATWATDSGLVVAQVFDRSGAKVGVEIAVNAAATNLATSDIRPSIAPLASGGFVVTWEVFSFTSGVDIVGRVFNASGTPVTAQFPVTSFAVENRQDFPSVAALPDGGFFVTWRSTNQDNPGQAGSGFFGQRFDASGAKVGGEFQINQTVLGEQIPTTAGDYALALLAGDLVAVWQSSPPGTLGDVFARTFAPYNGTFEISPLTPNADEGSGFTFTITRLGGTGNATIQYNTADDSATAPGDYTATSGSVELAPGASATITVAGVEDTIDEASETFTVTLSNPTNGAAITDGMGVATATILDNDPTPTVSISDAQVTEGGELSFDVTLSAASGQTVTVDYATANGTAAAPDDYTAVTSTTLKFLPGQTSQTVTVTTIDDALDELAETLRVDLSGATNATIVDAIGQGTINDNDATPLPVVTVLAQDASGSEAGPDTVTFRFTRTGSTAMPLTVSFTVGGTVSDADFSPLVPTSINIPVGSASFDLVLTPDNDPTFEGSEDVTITLTETADYGLGPSGSEIASATIADNDLPPAFSISDATIVEGGNLSFTVTLDDPSGQTATVKYATSDGSAAAPGDYTAVNLTTLTFLPGQISKTVTVTTIDDAFDEPAETLKVTLSDATDATIFDAIGLGTIDDNDAAPLPVVTVAAFDGAGSETGPDGVTFRFTRTGDTSAPLTVSFTTGGTASGADVNPAVPTSTTIPIGSAFADLVLTPVDDTLIEGAESINVTLTDTAAYDLGAPATQAASATIADNDAASSSALTVKFVSASASYKNAFGWYNTQTLDGGLLFDAQGGKGLRSGASTTIDVDTADIPNIAYFLIPNAKGLRDNTADELSGAIKVVQMADGRWAIATVDANGNVETSSGGVPNVLVGTGAPALFSETSKNAGGVDYASSRSGKSQTAATLLADTADGPVGTLAWEDFAAQRRPNGTFGKPGDADYNDAVLSVSVTHGTTQDGTDRGERLNGTVAGDVISGKGGSDTIRAGAGDDRVAGDAGNDFLTGGPGDDTFVFAPHSGLDTIVDFGDSPGDEDVIEVQGGLFSDIGALLNSLTQVGQDVVLELSPTDRVTLRRTSLGDLDANDFLIV